MTAKFEVDQRTTVRKITTMMCIALALLMIILGEEMRAAIYEGLIFSITTKRIQSIYVVTYIL